MAAIMVALDVTTRDEALDWADRLPDLEWVKIGPMLFLRHGPALVAELRARGLKVFLDLKWHDIPHSVAGAVAAAAELGVELATVHCLGGEAMLRAAMSRRGSMRLAAVSVLTSHSAEAYGAAIGREVDLAAEVRRLVGVARAIGLEAIVTSPREVAAVRAEVPDTTWLVVPGIRLPGGSTDDQERVGDPATAVANGATHLVVGRAILRAERPLEVYHRLCDAIRAPAP